MRVLRSVTLLMLWVLLLGAAQFPVLAAPGDPIRLFLNGAAVATDVPPQVVNGRTLVPVRVIAESLGAKVEWEPSTQKVTISGPCEVVLRVGQPVAEVNRMPVGLDVPPQFIDGRVLVPLRFVAGALGFFVTWDGQTPAVRLEQAVTGRVLAVRLNGGAEPDLELFATTGPYGNVLVTGRSKALTGGGPVTVVEKQGAAYPAKLTGDRFAAEVTAYGPVQKELELRAGSRVIGEFQVTVPADVYPAIAYGNGLVLRTAGTDPGVTLRPSVSPEGLLLLDGALSQPGVTAVTVHDYNRTAGKTEFEQTVAVQDGRFHTVLAFPGPAEHIVDIVQETGTAARLWLEQVTPSTRVPLSITDPRLVLDVPAFGGEVPGMIRLKGEVRNAPSDAALYVWVLGAKWGADITGRIPLTGGKFDVSIPIAYAPGSYNLLLRMWADEKLSDLASIPLLVPEGPPVARGGGITVLSVGTADPSLTLLPTVDADGWLVLTGKAAAGSRIAAVEIQLDEWPVRRVNLENGGFQVRFPVPGPSLEKVWVMAYPERNGQGVAWPAASLAVSQETASKAEPTRTSYHLDLLSPAAGGGEYREYVTVSVQPKGKVDSPYMLAGATLLDDEGVQKDLHNSPLIPLKDGRWEGKVWLPLGAGVYSIVLIAQVDGELEEIRLYVTNTSDREFRDLAPETGAESDDPEIVALANRLVAGARTDMERLRAVHDWVAQNIRYDLEKYRHPVGYVHSALVTLHTGKGVCGDYADLAIALFRAVGIRARLVVGDSIGYDRWEGHAWLEAWADGRWVTMDPTWDSGYLSDGQFVPRFQTEYFDPDPEEFAKTHRRDAP